MEIYARNPLKENGGIKVFTENDFYWGVSSREIARQFIESAESIGFREAIKLPQFEVFKKYALGSYRADFHFMLPLKKDAVILDLGSGYGNITIPLAKHYKEVVAVDSTLELLKFSEQFSISEGVRNVHYVHADPLDFCNLPFNEKCFDAILMNGVLEWVGPADTSKSAGEVQRQTLSYLKKFLKDDGFLYVGIENRFYPMYFYNVRDPHSKIRYTAIMPRMLADLYMHLRGFKEGYRTWIYSLGGYRRLLSSAGLFLDKIMYPFPSYRMPFAIFYKDAGRARKLFKQRFLSTIYSYKLRKLYRLMFFLGADVFFAHSFQLIARPSKVGAFDSTPSALRMAIEHGCKNLESTDELLKISENKDDSGSAFFWVFKKGENKPRHILALARDPSVAPVSPKQGKSPSFTSGPIGTWDL